MTIRRERPSQRLHHRLTAPLKVTLDGLALRALDWSLGGMRLDGFWEQPAVGDVLEFMVGAPFQGFDVMFAAKARVVRVTEAGQVAFAFVELGERESELLSFFAAELTSGSMTGVDGVIRRIDAPVTPISTKPDPNPAADTPMRRLPFGKIARYLGYSALGVLVFGYLGFMVFMNVWKLEAPSAVVSAPIANLLSTAGGTLIEAPVPENGRVAKGDTLFVIEDPDLEEQIHRARVMVRRMALERELAQAKLDRLDLSLGERRKMLRRRIDGAEAALTALRAQAQATAASHARLAALATKGLMARSRVDAAAAAAAADRARVAEKEEERDLAADALAAAESGQLLDARRGEARLGAIRAAGDALAQGHAEFAAAERRVSLAEEELSGLERRRERIAVRAPSDGRIARIAKPVGAGVRRGEILGLFEQAGDRGVDVFLTQTEAAAVSRHRIAQVWLPVSDRRFEARIIRLDRTAGALDPASARYAWVDDDARGVLLRLEPITADGRAALAETDPGSPAAVVFDRMSTPRRFARAIGDLFGGPPAFAEEVGR